MNKIIDTLHHFFVPRQTNNYTAKLLHHDFLTVYLVAALILTAGVSHIQKSKGAILGYATDINVEKLYDLTNVERTKEHLAPLTYNDKLAEAAKLKAANMFKEDYWSHYGPEGETPWQFILESGYQYEYAGENLAKNFLFSDGVVEAWMNSPTHRENMLRKEYTDVGYAVVNGILNGEETTLVVQMFGKPLYPSTANSVSDVTPKTDTVEQTAPVQETAQQQEAQVLAKEAAKPSSFFPTYFNMNLIFFAVLFIALLMDFYFAAKLNLIRVKGKNLVHLMFIGFIIVGAFIIIKGSIV
jgi:hypothetical protein